MFDFFNNRLFDLNRDGKVDIFEKAFVYHTLFAACRKSLDLQSPFWYHNIRT